MTKQLVRLIELALQVRMNQQHQQVVQIDRVQPALLELSQIVKMLLIVQIVLLESILQ